MLLVAMVTPSIVPPFISAVVTVPRLAIVVPLNVLFLPITICSLLFVVVNFMYELLPCVMFKASAKLSVNDSLGTDTVPLIDTTLVLLLNKTNPSVSPTNPPPPLLINACIFANVTRFMVLSSLSRTII